MTAARTIAIALLALVSLFGTIFAGSITGTLTDLASGSPVVGATVYAYDANNVLVSEVKSGTDGVFTVPNVSGHYTLRTVHAGYSNSYFTADVGNEESLNLGVLLLVPNAQVSFTVKNTSGHQISGCIVKAMQNGNEVVRVFSGCSGTIQLSPGDYDISFEAPFYVAKSQPVSPGPGDSILLSPTLDSSPVNTVPTVVSVTVQASDTTPTAGDEVMLSAVAHYNDGHDEDVTMSATWDTGNAGALYLPTLIATSAGSRTVRATFLGVDGSLQLTIAHGEPKYLDLAASRTSVGAGQQVTLSSYLVDAYSNRWATGDVAYTATCGTISGNTFTAPSSACTAHITAVYNPNPVLNDTITISVIKQEEEKDKDKPKPGTSTGTNTSNTSPTVPPTPVVPSGGGNTTNNSGVPNTVKVIMPAKGYVGEEVRVTVLDANSDPLKGIVLTLVWPDGAKVSLVTGKKGEAKFTPHIAGKYKITSTKYAIVGDTELEAVEKPGATSNGNQPSPIVPPVPVDESGDNTSIPPQGPERGMLGTIFAAFAGEISPADAIRATMPLWLVVGGIILAAALFFVVYTFLAGKLPDPEEKGAAGPETHPQPQKEVITVSKPELPKEQLKPADEISLMESEVDELKRELEEKMQRLKRAKEGRR